MNAIELEAAEMDYLGVNLEHVIPTLPDIMMSIDKGVIYARTLGIHDLPWR